MTPNLLVPAPAGERSGASDAPPETVLLASPEDQEVELGAFNSSCALDRVAQMTAALTRGAGAAVLLASPIAGRFQVAASSGAFPVPLDGLVRVENGQLIGGDALPLFEVQPTPQPGAGVAVPIDAHGLPLGYLVTTPLDGGAGSELVPQLQRLVHAAALPAFVQRATAQETQLTELNAILEVGQVLTGLLDMEDVLSYVVYLAESLVGGHAASVALISEDGAELILKNSTGSLRESEGRRIPMEGNLLGWVARHGEPVVTESISDDPRGDALVVRQGPGIVVPITNSGQIVGIFVVARLEGSPVFADASAFILQRMSVYAAIAITNAAIHRKQQEIADTLRSQAAELEEAYGELSRSQDQLLVSEKMAALGRITAGIAHEINSPLGGILNSLRAARGFVEEYRSSAGDPDITTEDHHAIAGDILSALDVADAAVNKVAQFVRSIKGQTRVGEAHLGVFDPAAEVDSTVLVLQHELKRRRVAVFTEMDRGHSLTGDQGKFGMVIQNLISNAMDAYNGEPGEIWVRIAADGDWLRVRVEDRGCGIPPELRGRIFDYLFTTKDVGKGTGLGLAMVHSVVTSNFHGEIALESEVGVGTTFTISFPLTSATN